MHEVYVWVPFEPWWLVVPLRVLFLVELRSNIAVAEVLPLVLGWLEFKKSLHPLPQHSLAQGLVYSFSRVFQHPLEKRCRWV